MSEETFEERVAAAQAAIDNARAAQRRGDKESFDFWYCIALIRANALGRSLGLGVRP